MKVQVIGFGSAGSRHATNAARLGAAVAVHDSDPARQAAATGHGFAEAKPADRADVVVVAVPVGAHADAVAQWATKRKSPPTLVLVEKPLALDVAAAKSIGDVCVAYNWRYHPALDGLREHAEPSDTFDMDVNVDMASWPGKDYGDPLLECSHEIDWLRWVRGPSLALTSAADNDGALRLLFSTGDALSFRFFAPPSRRVKRVRADGATVKTDWPSLGQDLDHSYVRMLQDVLDAAAKRREPERCARAAEAVDVLRICERAQAFLAGAGERKDRRRR